METLNYHHEIEPDNKAWTNIYNGKHYDDGVKIISDDFNNGFKRIGKDLVNTYIPEIGNTKVCSKFNYIDEKGNLLSTEWFDNSEDFSISGFAVVTKGNKKTLLNYKGFIFKDLYKEIGDFSEYGLAPILNEQDKCNFINTEGKVLTEQWFDMSLGFKDGSISGNAPIKLNGRWNYIDVDGEYISEEWFDIAGEYVDFRAYVGKIPEGVEYSDDNLVYNYLDINGELILQEWFSDEEGVYLAMSEDIYLGDEIVGKKIFCGGKYDLYDAEKNLIITDIGDIEIMDNDYYIKDREGKTVKGKGIFKLYNEGKENLFSLDSNKVIFKDWYDYIRLAKLGWYKHIYNFIVSKKDKYYLSDIDGNIVSKGYDDIESCDSMSYAILSISEGDNYNFLTPKGKELSNIWFDDCEDFKNIEFTKVSKGESKNFLSIDGKLLTDLWFDECIFFNEGYAIVKINDKELIVGDYGNYEYEGELEDNKYFQDKEIFDNFENDKEFIAFFVYLDYYMSKTYEGPHGKMKDYTLGFNNVEETLKKFIFVLNNYKAFENKITFLNEEAFENKYHHKAVGRREGLLSLAIHYLIESDEKLKNRYNGNFYYNIGLSYMDSFFKNLLQWYKDQGVGKTWEDKYEGGQESYILGEKMYDVVYWENIYLTYGEGQWTPFCTGGYLDCVKREYETGKLIDGADPKTFTITDKGYSKDKNNIYRYGLKIEGVDINSFEVLNYRYCKDKHKVYYYNPINKSFDEVKGIDLGSFKIINKDYLKDNNSVYYWGKMLEGVNPKEFEILSSEYSKDSSRIFYNGDICKWADYSTFEIIDEDYVKDKNNISFFGSIIEGIDIESYNIMETSYYIKDKDHVFVYVDGEFVKNPGFKKINDVDLESFETLEYNYSKDKNNIYYDNVVLEGMNPNSYEFLDESYIYLKSGNTVLFYGEKIESVDIDSFEVLDSWYSKDKNNIYHRTNILKGVDYESFKIQGDRKAVDKNNNYYEGEIVNS